MRAWIEISPEMDFSVTGNSRPLHEGVDWNSDDTYNNPKFASRPLHEGVDWNQHTTPKKVTKKSRPLHEGVDWNTLDQFADNLITLSPSSRGRGLKYRISANNVDTLLSPSSWGRGLKYRKEGKAVWKYLVALFMRAWIEMIRRL